MSLQRHTGVQGVKLLIRAACIAKGGDASRSFSSILYDTQFFRHKDFFLQVDKKRQHDISSSRSWIGRYGIAYAKGWDDGIANLWDNKHRGAHDGDEGGRRLGRTYYIASWVEGEQADGK
jgi:hypothetical protein